MILLSPYSRGLRNGKRNPKNYPWFDEVVKILSLQGEEVVQVGAKGEEKIPGVKECVFGASLDELGQLVEECLTWVSVDNFFHHFCYGLGKQGVVIFGPSDPNIYGHAKNINLLKDRKYLRPDQFGLWESLEYSEERFVDPLSVTKAVRTIVGEKNGNPS